MAKAGGALVFSSRLLGRDAAVEGYRALYAAGAHVEPIEAEVFASVRSQAHPGMVVFQRRVAGLSQCRDAAMVRRTGFDHFTFQHVVSGELRLELGGDRSTLHAGECALLDMTRPFATEAADCRFHTLSLPRKRLAEAGLDLSRLHGAVLPAAAAPPPEVFAALMGPPDVDAAALLDRLLRPMRRARAAGPGEDGGELRRRERACAYIEAHLDDSDLTPAAVAAGSHTSRSTLYRTFEDLGGVSGWVLARRLRRLRTALARDPRPLVELIGEFGFVSVSHATRAFQAQYGLTPGALRKVLRAAPRDPADPAGLTRRRLSDMPTALVQEARTAQRSAA